MQANVMDLAKLFRESHIVPELVATDRDDLLREFLDRLVENGVLQGDATKDILAHLLRRESLGSTGIGRGVAIPHAKLKNLDGVVAAIGRCTAGVDYNSTDGEPVNIVFIILSPADDADSHVAILKRVSMLARNADFRNFFLRSKTTGEAIALIQEMAEELC